MKKQNYEAPVMEQMVIKFEQNIMSDVTTSAPSNMNVWNEQEI